MTDDIFRSMKAQMEPSDQTVADLLAKIAAEAPSPVTDNDNVIPFQQPAVMGTTPTKHFAKKTKKSMWFYGTAVAASVIVMISTFALLGPDDGADGHVGELFQSVIGSGADIVHPDQPGDETENPGNMTDPASDGEQISDDSEENQASGQENPADSSKDPEHGKHSSGSSGMSEPSHGQDSESENAQDYDDPDSADGTGSSGSGENNSSKPAQPDNGKITPGASGTADISWTSEIVNSSQVASISVSGSNYVVSSTVSKSDVGSALDTVTIDLPQTSTTNAARVKAKVCKVKNVSADAVVALDVDGFTEPLVYANADYSPSTLGAFVSDLGLSGNISFSSTVRCQISHVGYSSNKSCKADVGSAAWNWILCQSDAERSSKSSFSSGNSKALFTSSSNPTGAQMKFGVSDNGYLWVSMLNREFTFHIGSSNAKGFLESVTGESFD